MNEFKKTEEAAAPKQAANPPKMIRAVDFAFNLDKDSAMKLFPFIMYLTLLAIIYIANAHMAERTIRQTDKLNKEIKELRSEYITIKSDLMSRSMQSEVARRLASSGIEELRNPPRKIVIDEDEY